MADPDTFVIIKAYEDMLLAIVEHDSEIDDGDLIKAWPFMVTYNEHNMIISISRQ